MALSTKGKFILGGAGALVLIGGTLWVVHHNKKNEKGKRAQQSAQSATSGVDYILKQNTELPPELRQIPSYSPAQMDALADTLEGAMRGAGTEDNDLQQVFMRMKHDLDVMLLVEAFGVRDEENLAQWLAADGATAEANQVLKTKPRITFRF